MYYTILNFKKCICYGFRYIFFKRKQANLVFGYIFAIHIILLYLVHIIIIILFEFTILIERRISGLILSCSNKKKEIFGCLMIVYSICPPKTKILFNGRK